MEKEKPTEKSEKPEKRAKASKEVAGTPISEWSAGSQPLKEARRERYAQYCASGLDSLESYYRAFKDDEGAPRCKKSTGKSAAAKIRKCKEVKDRLAYLQRENSNVARIDREAKLKITEEVIAGLREDFRKGERGKTVNDLMSALQRHDAMTGEGEKPSLEIKLNFGGLISGIEKLVETRLGIEGGGGKPVAVLDLPTAKEAEVIEEESEGEE